MAIPDGYEKLAVIGIVNKGEYSEGGEYKQYNYVYYEGSTYLALKDNPAVPPTNNKVDWQYLAQGVVGAKGDKGEPGAKGEQGVSITDARIEDGVLHISLSDGNDVTAGSIAITKDAVVDALAYTPEPQRKKMEVTLELETWKETGGIWLYDIDLQDVSKNQHVLVTAPPGLTADQINAFADATITGNKQIDNQITLQAMNKPTMELPIVIEIGGVVENANT